MSKKNTSSTNASTVQITKVVIPNTFSPLVFHKNNLQSNLLTINLIQSLSSFFTHSEMRIYVCCAGKLKTFAVIT